MIKAWAIIYHPWDTISSRWSTLVSTPGSPPSRKDSRRSRTLLTNTPRGKKKQDNASPPSSSSSNNKRTIIGTSCSKVSTLATRLTEEP
jgi:hypothetical protein